MQLSRYIKKIIKNQNFKARLNCSMHGLFLKISHLMFILVCRNILLPRTFSKLIKLFIFCYALIMPLNCLEYDVTWKGCLFFFWNWIWVLTRSLRVFLMCGGIYDFSEKKYMLKAHSRNFKIFMNINGFMN